jgi:hypothetical protein
MLMSLHTISDASQQAFARLGIVADHIPQSAAEPGSRCSAVERLPMHPTL